MIVVVPGPVRASLDENSFDGIVDSGVTVTLRRVGDSLTLDFSADLTADQRAAVVALAAAVIDPDTLDRERLTEIITEDAPGGGSTQTFSTLAPSSTVGFAEGDAWWQVVDGEVLGFWQLASGVWESQEIVTVAALTASNAFIDTLATVDLSTVNLEAVNIDGGSVAIAVTADGGATQAFSGTSLPGGWVSTITGQAGTGVSTGAVSVAVINAGAPAGASGSTLKIDYGPSGQTSAALSAAGTIDTGFDATDALISARIRAAVHSTAFFDIESLRFMLRASGLAWDTATEDGLYLEFTNDVPEIKAIVNGADSTLATLPALSDLSTAWHQLRFRAVAGQVQAKVWREGDTEPAWTTVQQSSGLDVGPVRIDWRVFPFVANSTGQEWFIDDFDVTTYATGFKVNPDGTGDWPAALDPIRDRVTELEGDAAWDTFTPTLAGSWTVGNGTIEGWFRKVGRTVDVKVRFTYGSTSTASGNFGFVLDWTHANSGGGSGTGNGIPVGQAAVFDSSATTAGYRHAIVNSATLRMVDASGVLVNATVPSAPATGDIYSATVSYETTA